jgi:ketosteroid isomerase-like protein
VSNSLTEPSAREMGDCVEAYFACIANRDIAGMLNLLTPDCILEVMTADVRHEGHDAIRGAFERRLDNVAESWQGNFAHIAEPENDRMVSRFEIRRTHKDGTERTLNNINFIQFEGSLMKHISVWMSAESAID